MTMIEAMRVAFATGAALVLGTTFAGCLSAEEQRRADLYEDGGTCADYGARYGSRGHTQCMLQQQQRRDQSSS